MNLFLDTNVLMDVIANREPFYHASAAVWSRTGSRGIVGWIAAISFNNVFYLTRKAAGAEAAIKAVIILREAFQVVPLDVDIVDRAIASGARDFEDAIQLCCALRAGANFLVTRNVRDFPASRLAIVSPEELLAVLGISDARS